MQPRGPLTDDERANVELFRTASPSVVHITTIEVARDLFSMDQNEVERGTGAGFIRDELGHVVANRVVPRLIRDQRFVRPALGINAAPETFGRALKLPEGVAILRVLPGGSAERAGLKAFARGGVGGIVAGDVITAVDGQPVRTFDDLMASLEQRSPGDPATLTVWRAGSTRREAVRLSESE